MASTSKTLVVELESSPETACRITGTKESLRLLAQDLSKAAEEIPDQTAVSYVQLPGWEQHTFEVYQDGFYFSVAPDIESYIMQRRASRSRLLPWIHGAFGVIVVALALVGIRTVWLWIF